MTSVPALLDVNVLVALFASHHVHHEAAHRWFASGRALGWATCPLTENGLVRILSNPVAAGVELRSTEVAQRLRALRASGNHLFWADDVSLCDRTLYRLDLVAGPKQLTDVYLLGLARHRGGRLATFDRAIPLGAVRGADESHRVVIAA